MRTASLPKKVLEKFPEMEGKVARMKYIRALQPYRGENDRGVPVGVILLTTEGTVGWSLLGDKDKWDRIECFKRAWYRASKGGYQLEERKNFFGSHLKDPWKKASHLLFSEFESFEQALSE